MRCLNVLAFIIFFGSLPTGLKGQNETEPKPAAKQSLPKEALQSKYRIQLMESGIDGLETMRTQAKAFAIKFKRNAYIVKSEGLLQLQAGDFIEKRYAKPSLASLKKQYSKSRIVRSLNDSILEFERVEKRKPVKVNSLQDYVAISYEKYSGKMSDWDDPKYQAANTAISIDYLSEQEKQVFYYLNLVRINPKLFADTYLSFLKDSKDYYESSLREELYRMQPVQILKPSPTQFESARCHAVESGKTGYTGHVRDKCKASFVGECCSYGIDNAMGIVLQLLIDSKVKSLGHRQICLSKNYNVMGVSIQPHKLYGFNAVIDFSIDVTALSK